MNCVGNERSVTCDFMFISILQLSYAAVTAGRRGSRLASGGTGEKAKKEEAAVKAAEAVSMETIGVKKEETAGGERKRREVSLESHALLAPLFESLVVVREHLFMPEIEHFLRILVKTRVVRSVWEMEEE